MRQIAISNCVVYESSRAVALYSHEGAEVEDVVISNIVCDTRSPLLVNRPIQLDLRRSKEGVLGCIRNISISNVVARTDGRIIMVAEPGAMLENITLRDIHLIYPTVDDPDPIAGEMMSGQFCIANRQAGLARAAVVVENIKELVVDGLRITWPDAPCPDDWRFPIKGANGMFRLFEREQFNHDTTPDFSILWGRNLRGGYINAPLARPSRDGVPAYLLEDSAIASKDRE
jgi:hypothetical protein